MFRSLIFSAVALALAAQAPAPEAAKPVVVAPETAAAPAAAPAEPKGELLAAPKPEAKPQPKVDKILARIGSEVVRTSDFDLFLEVSLNEQQRMQLAMMPGGRDQYLGRFLEFKVLAAKARMEGFQKSPAHARKLAIMDMQLLIQALMERDGPPLQAKLVLKDEEAKAYFETHPDKFVSPESYSARHILVLTKAQGDEKVLTDEEAKAKVAKIQADLAAGKTFEVAAKEYSDDPGSKDKGGLYENKAFGSFVPQFEAAVRTQEVGKVGQPVKSDYGYHLIQVEKLTPAVPQTFEAAKESARQLATAARQEQVMKDYMDAAKKSVSYAAGASEAAAPAKTAPKTAPKAKKVGK